MFENILRELENLGRQPIQYKFPIEVDEDGYIDKECPNEECLFQFKIHNEDWKNICKDEAIYCPKCGKSETSDKWFTTEQVEEGKRQAINNINARIGRALNQDATQFNRRQSKGFIKLNMKVSGFKRYETFLPISCKDIIEQKIVCEHCGTRYAVVGSAFYCPACGTNSASQTFNEFINTTYSKLNNIENIRNAIENKDDAERIIRALLESVPNDLVESIQCLSESIYNELPNKKELKKNVFQRIYDSDKLWREAVNQSFENWLTPDEFTTFKIYYQKRHLFSHTNGIVDEEYITKTNDTNYKVGERLVINEKDAKEFTKLVEKVGSSILNIKLD